MDSNLDLNSLSRCGSFPNGLYQSVIVWEFTYESGTMIKKKMNKHK